MGEFPERSKGADCKSVDDVFAGSNPALPKFCLDCVMRYKYHGVRGSRATPFTISDISRVFSHLLLEVGIDKIVAIQKKLREKLAKTNKDEYFSLNEKMLLAEFFHDFLQEENTSYMGLGTNSPCVEVQGDATFKEQIIFDLGSGSTNVSIFPSTQKIHIFFTHFHYDHIQGFPFFGILYNPNIEVHFYSPYPGFKTIVEEYMQYPYFPVTIEKMTKKRYFHPLKDRETVRIGDLHITSRPINHPGGCFSYKITDKQKKTYCYFSDVNITEELFQPSCENKEYLMGIDKMGLDCAMSFEDSVSKKFFGHSNFYIGIDFAELWNIKSIDIFHYDPASTIADIPSLYQSALWYKQATKSMIDVKMAEEGKWVTV